MLILQFHSEHGIGQRLNHRCHYLNRVLFAQIAPSCRLPASSQCRSSFLIRQHHGAVSGYSNAVLEVSAVAAIHSDGGPLVIQNPGIGFSDVDHRLDGQHHTFSQSGAMPAHAEIWHLRLFMQSRANAMSYKLTHYAEAV